MKVGASSLQFSRPGVTKYIVRIKTTTMNKFNIGILISMTLKLPMNMVSDNLLVHIIYNCTYREPELEN